MWRDILVHVDGSTAGRDRAEYSLRLAELMGAKVHGLHVEQPLDVPPLFKPRMIPAVEKYQERVSKRDADQSELAFHEIARPSDSWTAIKGDIIEGISQHAAYCDLAIVGQYETTGTPEKRPLTLATSLVLKCGRPVLLLPASHKVLPANPYVALAWDGHPHTSRAMHDALPLLKKARHLRAVTVSPDKEHLIVGHYRELLAEHLAHHSVQVSEHLVSGGRESEVLEALLSDSPDILVMGAYEHSPWFELLFGGLTQSAALNSQIPVLFSH